MIYYRRDMKNTIYLNFEQQRVAARSVDGWLQGRYYTSDGLSVRKFLSFNEVFEICPFEVGVSRVAEKRAHRQMLAKVTDWLELSELLPRSFQSLSNGEMRRVLFARAILKCPDELVLDDPMAGLDPVHCARFKEIISALEREGIAIRLRCRHRDERPGAKRDVDGGRKASGAVVRKASMEPMRGKIPVVELNDICVKFGPRVLFDHLNWTIHRGERWVLKGCNGSGKTTLLALVTGDSPLGYANEVRVFGQRRGEGVLAEVRRRIGMVSPEMQTYGDKGPEELLDEALAGEPELLLLDEPCLNLGVSASRRLLRKIAAWLKTRPKVTAVCVAHRPDHVPPGFDLELDLGGGSGSRRKRASPL